MSARQAGPEAGDNHCNGKRLPGCGATVPAQSPRLVSQEREVAGKTQLWSCIIATGQHREMRVSSADGTRRRMLRSRYQKTAQVSSTL